MGGNLYLGIDASTQSMSAALIDIENPSQTLSLSVNFEKSFPEYGTRAGAAANPEAEGEVWSYPQMWLEALDAAMRQISERADAAKIKAASGAGQQHATVYLKSPGAFAKMRGAQKGRLAESFKDAYATPRAPIWMDNSTSEQCRQIVAQLGQDYILRQSGSLQTERFSGAQIRKIFQKNPGAYNNTARIHLNSSFICSALCNADAPADYCDAAGMNLLNLHTFQWDAPLLDATAPRLLEKLPKLASPQSQAGNIGEYFCRAYGFSPAAKVFAFTGDNPSSLVGCGASGKGRAVISLGTSDTLFCANENCAPVAGAHVFGNPSGGYMNLACFRNGSLARERLKDELGISWREFDSSFENYMPADDGKTMLPFYFDEISPKIKASHPTCFGCSFESLDKLQAARLFIEGQIFNIKMQAEAMKAEISDILLTGGASKSAAIAQCAANVFGCNVYLSESQENSSALGGALRAASADQNIPIQSLQEIFCARKLAATPQKQATTIYNKKFHLYTRGIAP